MTEHHFPLLGVAISGFAVAISGYLTSKAEITILFISFLYLTWKTIHSIRTITATKGDLDGKLNELNEKIRKKNGTNN